MEFQGFAEPAERVIQATAPAAINRADIYNLPWTGRWVGGRIALIGDAAHAITPNLGQGACQAMADAVSLAKLLRNAEGDVPATLRAYEQKRLKAMHSIYKRSHLLGRVRNWQSPFFCTMRNVSLRLVINKIETSYHRRDISQVV